jgi:hypothetical protein
MFHNSSSDFGGAASRVIIIHPAVANTVPKIRISEENQCDGAQTT